MARRCAQSDADPHLRHRLRQAEELDAYLKRIEEAEKRDHRRLGREMDLFHFQEEAPGSVFWHPKGWTLFQALEHYIRRRQDTAGYVEVNSPQLMDSELWVATGHMQDYRDVMFLTEKRAEDERVYAIKPMNCPGHVQIFKHGLKSYRDLPLKIAEFGKVHRYEPSGALHGLMRVRAFTQDDAHIFITEHQIAEEALKVNNMILSIYEDFGFPDVRIKFSDRPDKRIGDDAVWDKAEAALMAALEASGRPWTLNKGEGAFYGPKLEYVLRDAIGRDWQCGTVQVDLNLPGRLGAFYIDEHSDKVTPVMLHRAMFGSLERFTGILIEHFAGHFPLWLAPTQAAIATIVSDADGYARSRRRGTPRRPAGRARSAQREDQLQGARALARQGAGAAGGRQEGGGEPHGVDPPAGQPGPEGDGAGRGAGGACRGGGGAGCAAGAGERSAEVKAHIRRAGSLGLRTLRALGTAHRQAGRIEQADLHQHARLIPVDVLVRDFPAPESDDDGDRHLHGLSGGATPGTASRLGRVGETDHELVHHLIVPDGAGHAGYLHVRRKELPTDDRDRTHARRRGPRPRPWMARD